MSETRKERGRPSDLPVVGWREWIALPELGIARIKAKVDTGARSSALHAVDQEVVERAGKTYVRFSVFPIQRKKEGKVRGEALLLEHRSVRSSSGRTEVRPVVELEVEMGGRRFPVEVTLTRRDRMGFRMLLGRTALRRRFRVDPGRSFLLDHSP